MPFGPEPKNAWRRRRIGLWLIWAAALGLLSTAIFLPNTELARLRSEFVWLSRTISWTEKQWPTLDAIHIALFAGLTVLAAVSWPRSAWPRVGAGLLSLAAITELCQFWVPGRRPSWGDFTQDVLGIALGCVLVLLASQLLRLLRGCARLMRADAPTAGRHRP